MPFVSSLWSVRSSRFGWSEWQRRARAGGRRRAAFGAHLLVLALGASAFHCSAPATPAPAEPDVAIAKPPVIDEGPKARELAALTRQEQQIVAELTEELQLLSEFGARSAESWNLAGATDHVASRLTSYGYEVNRRGFSWEGRIAQNIEVEVPGLRRGNQLVVVGTRLDTNADSPGADDNSSGVAAALVLAKHRFSTRALRSLRFVFFSSAGPRSTPEAQGSFHYSEQLDRETRQEEDAREILVVLELNGLGAYSDAAGSQLYPDGVPASGVFGEFIALVSSPEAAMIASHARESLEAHATLPIRHWSLLRDHPFFEETSVLGFLEHGFPTLLVTDTRHLRFPDFGSPNDTADRLDVARMARVVAALEPALLLLTGPFGEAPEINAHHTPSPGGSPALTSLP